MADKKKVIEKAKDVLKKNAPDPKVLVQSCPPIYVASKVVKTMIFTKPKDLLIPIKKKYDKIVVGKKGRTKKPKII